MPKKKKKATEKKKSKKDAQPERGSDFGGLGTAKTIPVPDFGGLGKAPR